MKNQNSGQKLVLRKTELRVLNEIELERVAGGIVVKLDENDTEACIPNTDETQPTSLTVFCIPGIPAMQLTALCPEH